MRKQKAETAILRDAKDALERVGYLVRRVHSGKVKVRGGWMQLAEPGTGDLVVQGARFMCWLEMKSADGAQNDDQEIFEAEVIRRSGIYLTARSPAEAVEKVRAIGGPA